MATLFIIMVNDEAAARGDELWADAMEPEDAGDLRVEWEPLEVHQRMITETLHAQSPRLSEWYVSAVTVLHDRRPAAWMSIVGHLCRDLMNGAPRHFNLPVVSRVDYGQLVGDLDDALPETLADDPGGLDSSAWAALRALVGEHRRLSAQLSPEDLFAAAGRPATGSEAARRELDRSWRETQRFFQSVTHIRDPGRRDPDPIAVQRHFTVLEDLLGAQMRAVPYWSLDAELQEIAALEDPEAGDLQRAARLWRGEAEQAFYEALSSPRWVPLLVAAGFLNYPPPPEQVGGGTGLPFWAVSRYLARIAERAPGEVLAAIRKLPDTDNGRVHADLIDAAKAMPAAEAAEVAALVPAWLARPWGAFAAENAAGLVT